MTGANCQVNGHKGKQPDFGREISTLVRIDPHQPGQSQPNLHTRWHPDIPCVADIEEGQAFRVQCIDYSGGQIKNDDAISDVECMSHDSDHHLSGPFWVPSARAGDCLEIEILEVRPFDSQPWGYCITSQGLGSLDDENTPTKMTKSIWDFSGGETSSRHVPRVRFQGRPHVGCIGTAPSAEALNIWKRREGSLKQKDKGAGVSEPTESGAYVGQDLDPKLKRKIYQEGARTTPGREHGGNIDISALVSGSKVYLPVYVRGAKLSVGDLHFCQSEGEPTTAIEMSGTITLRVNVIPHGIHLLSLKSPMYQTSPSELRYPRQIVFTGLSTLPTTGEQTNCGGLVAYRNAAFSAMAYLQKFGYTREQAYIILSVAPVETRVVATANTPNFVVSVGLPIDIFAMDIRPSAVCRNVDENGASNGVPNGVTNGSTNGMAGADAEYT